ncbi:uncharacterized protein Tco025E_06386 [Trypanosoma conorhini]|uniref:DUF2804 domain-containing protein n=1 Tax=Trypanosoma conorhini TaxID=83891 RepID=A0A3S5ISR8_9TRYP|nr:uncharacterized protein Tco025E_06386 [Trypanosoma conorhini]RNF12970.1 hypothetical protein Tco025E_06386 [Trypanosoma conorhini]
MFSRLFDALQGGSGVGAAVRRRQVDAEVPNFAEADDVRAAFFSSALQHAKSSYDAERDGYVWGRTLRPSYALQLHPLNTVQTYTQKKEFVWVGLTAGPWFVGVVVLQFNYFAAFSVSLYNVESEESWRATSRVPLPGPWLGGQWVPNEKGEFGPTSAGHRVEFSAPLSTHRARLCFAGRSVQVDATGVVAQQLPNGKSAGAQRYEVHAVATLPEEFLGVVFPLGPRRAALVSKVAAAPLQSPLKLRLGGTEWSGDGYLSMDYTRGLLRRETRWHWASATAPAGYGFHLSEGAYDVDNKSVENTFYAGGRAVLLETRVEFHKVTAAAKVWTLTGDGIQLRFRHADAHDAALHVGVVKTDLYHAWGTFDGSIRVEGAMYKFDRVAGVLEDHYALW